MALKILIGVAAAGALLVIFVAVQPSKFHVEREDGGGAVQQCAASVILCGSTASGGQINVVGPVDLATRRLT